MQEFTINPVIDAHAVAKIIRSCRAPRRLWGIVLASFDNLREDYNAGNALEFGGIALTQENIATMVERQARQFVRRAHGLDRVVIVWKAESARLYGVALADAVRRLGVMDVATGSIATKWRRTAVADVIKGNLPAIGPRDFVVACDLMCGSGATICAIVEWMSARMHSPNAVCVLVNAVDYRRPTHMIALMEPCFEWQSLDWLIGYNSDCPSGGVSIGRQLPFLGFLRPAGKGIRAALEDALRRLKT